MQSAECKTLSSLDSPLNCDVVRFVPKEGQSHLLVLGQYQLDKEKQTTRGQLSLVDTRQDTLSLVCSEPTQGGVLHCEWLVLQDTPFLFVATTECSLEIYGLEHTLYKVQSIPLQGDGKCLFLDCRLQGQQIVMAMSLDNGIVLYLRLALQSDCFVVLQQTLMQEHSYSVWCCALGENHRQVLSGGDDCQLVQYNLEEDSYSSVKNRRTFQMGPCHITQWKDNLFLTGSYDQYIRLWDIRQMGKPLMEQEMADGVWRVQKNQVNGLLCAALFYNQEYQVLKMKEDHSALEKVAEYKEHSSLAYGVDWQPFSPERLVTSSFYDNLVKYWSLE